MLRLIGIAFRFRGGASHLECPTFDEYHPITLCIN